ncbi:hypothetical protein [Streptomyces sp. NBC_00503]|uniref:hypothetical protein n=1 Tax=Streptomyces sp. NBC_00503 TaxID=2903659 RepID=UPI002E807885|nr:hypothetical protein [Streptomyces sp. NBC_00503]WUD81475.1 hypothetical protein OG490_13505 [Streptomyces sp. NBC_00503]
MAIQDPGAAEVEPARRVRRAGLAAGGALGAMAVVTFVARGAEVAPWWVLAPGSVLVAALAGLAGARLGREDAVRAQALAPGEIVLGAHTVRPPYTDHSPSGPYESPPYQLRVTTRGMQLWERSVLLWNHPWPELRVVLDGPRLRVQHQGLEAGVMLLERAGAEHEVLATARRYGAG